MISQLRHDPSAFEDERLRNRLHGDSATTSSDGSHHGGARVGRSKSRRGRVENSIEASLTNAEPASHVRSRKSSHYLGLFKENTGGGGAGGRTAGAGSPDRKRKEDHHHHHRVKIHDELLPSEQRGGKQRPAMEESPELLEAHDDRPELHASKSAPQLHDALALDMQPEDDESELSDSVKYCHSRALPFNLLEEIRNFHLTPGGARGSSFSKSIPTQYVEGGHQDYTTEPDHHLTESPSSSSPTAAEHHGASSPQGSEPSEREEEEEEEEEDGEDEQISSALYFPHERVTVSDEVDQVPPFEHRHQAEDQDYGATPGGREEDHHHHALSSGEFGTGDEEQEANHVDISLRSKNDNQIFHGDLHSPVGGAATEPSLSTASERDESTTTCDSEAASTTDESGLSGREEESSLTDNAAMATPTQSFLRPRRKHRKEAPVGAVELKPYRHQVGGHTTVFRFSRRAVCKQLNNRENQFYERIERRHPEMLRFLARWVGRTLFLPRVIDVLTRK